MGGGVPWYIAHASSLLVVTYLVTGTAERDGRAWGDGQGRIHLPPAVRGQSRKEAVGRY